MTNSYGDQNDGDQLSFIAVNDPAFHPMFMTMCPTYTFIDRANGKFNSNMSFKREYSALISAAWEIDKIYDQYLSNPEAETSPEVILGIDGANYKENAIDTFINAYQKVLKDRVDLFNEKDFTGFENTVEKLWKIFNLPKESIAKYMDWLEQNFPGYPRDDEPDEEKKSKKKKKKDD